MFGRNLLVCSANCLRFNVAIPFLFGGRSLHYYSLFNLIYWRTKFYCLAGLAASKFLFKDFKARSLIIYFALSLLFHNSFSLLIV